jgi:hypothetical protein
MSGRGWLTADGILDSYGPPAPSLLPWVARWAPVGDLPMIAHTAARQAASTPSVRWPAVADAVAEVLAERAGTDPALIATLPRELPSVAAHFGPAQLELLQADPASTDALCYAALGHPGSGLVEAQQHGSVGADWAAILSAVKRDRALPPLANLRLLTRLATEGEDQLADGPDLIYLFPFQRSARQARRRADTAVTEIEEYIPARVPWYAAALCARVAPFLDEAQRARLASSARAALEEDWSRLLKGLAEFARRRWASATAEIDASHPGIPRLTALAEQADPVELNAAAARIARHLFERYGEPRPQEDERRSFEYRRPRPVGAIAPDLYEQIQRPLSVPEAAEPEDGEPSRHVNVLLAETGTDQPLPAGQPWRAGIEHDLLVGIGRRAAESILPGSDSRWPEELLPDRGLWLRAVLSWPSGANPVVHPIYLPRDGASFSCTCPFGGAHDPGCEDRRQRWARFRLPDPAQDEGRTGELVIYYQTAAVVVIRIRIPDGQSDTRPPRAELVGRLTTTFTDLGVLAERSASIVALPGYSHLLVNGVTFLDAPFATSAAPADEAAKTARNVLYDAHFETRDERRISRLSRSFGKTQDQFEADLRRLARLGAEPFGHLFLEQPGSDLDAAYNLHPLLRNEARLRGRAPLLQLIDERFDDSAVPWALVYDLPLGTDLSRYQLCRSVRDFGPAGHWTGDPPGYCPYPHEDGDVVCPYGFWGLSCVLDQPLLQNSPPVHVVCGDPDELSWMLISDPVPRDAVIADHLGRLQATPSGVHVTCPTVETVEVLARELGPELADVVYFYCHCGYESWYPGGAANRYLQIGSFRFQALDVQSWARRVWSRPHWPRRHPVVVLNGCHTAEFTSHTLNSFVPAFIRIAGAAGVVGTEITVEQGFACLVGELLLPLLAVGLSVGEALRSVRWDLLHRGNVLGLAYTSFCLANLTLRPNFPSLVARN